MNNLFIVSYENTAEGGDLVITDLTPDLAIPDELRDRLLQAIASEIGLYAEDVQARGA